MVRTLFTRRVIGAIAGSLLLAGCTTHKQETPSLTGPSALGTSLVVTVSPDVLAQDGASQSLVQIQAYDSNGQPLRNKSMRIEIAADGFTTDFGKLSARSVVTDNNGRASVTYTAPAPVLGISNTVNVDIRVTPSESDFNNATMRFVTIHLVPTGVVGAPTSPFVPVFSPPSATVGNPASFSASFTGTSSGAQVATFVWDFGDGDTAVGQAVQHTYDRPGTYLVTLGLVDTLGRVNAVTNSVTVGQGALPTALFVFSPTSPAVHETVNFNAGGSTAEAGHSITDYSWNFGDGTTGGGQTTTHSFATAGAYTVTLKVTDDAGRKSTLFSLPVTVGSGAPSASFTFAPSTPRTGTSVSFDASASTVATGRTIVSYSWNFDDGATGSGVQTSHTYTSAGTYQVRLTITDNLGQTSSTTLPVPVGNGNPTASFTFSPTTPAIGQNVFFDATQSSATAGRTISSYDWTWGDGSPAGTGLTPSHAFAAAGSYLVRLTVTDNTGQTGTTSLQVVVGGDPVASFNFAPAAPTVASGVNFDGTPSTASTGRTITVYSWNFGDSSSGSGSKPSHAYALAGTYTVTLTVTDSAGRTGTATQSVRIFP